MTLNEAIREGCRLRGEYQTSWFDRGGNCCVIGAAYVGGIDRQASLMNRPERWKEALVDRFPELDLSVPERPRLTVFTYMSHLHLVKKWSREAIAEWVDPHPELHVPMPTMTELKVVP